MSRTINTDLVKHIAVLSRIDLPEEEIPGLVRQFERILGHFNKLQELDTDSTIPLTHTAEIENVLRDDAPLPSLSRQQALENAPSADGGFFRVPKILGDS